jgi:hypothetical protein
MRVEQALTHFETNRAGLARMLEISAQAVGKWDEVVPYIQADRLEKMALGKIRLDPTLYDERGRPKRTEAA